MKFCVSTASGQCPTLPSKWKKGSILITYPSPQFLRIISNNNKSKRIQPIIVALLSEESTNQMEFTANQIKRFFRERGNWSTREKPSQSERIDSLKPRMASNPGHNGRRRVLSQVGQTFSLQLPNVTKDGSVRVLLWPGWVPITGTMSIFRLLVSMVAGNTEENGGRKLLLTQPLK